MSPPGFIALRAVGTVTALASLHGLDVHRHDGRRPVQVDVSAQEAVVFTSALPECAHVLFNCPGRAGSGRYVAPSGVFPCRDGLIRIAAIENHQWKGMVAALGDPSWTEGLEDRPTRAEQAAMINERVADWSSNQKKDECSSLLQNFGVPATAVNTPAELLDSPQLTHRRSVEHIELDGRVTAVLGPPWHLPVEEPVTERRPGIRELRIVELTHVLAGPIVGALLGAMGAQVVRVEDRSRLDIYRRTGPFADGVAGEERGAYFAVANHSKASVTADSDTVSEVTGRLLRTCDVLIENVGQGRLNRLGVDPAKLAQAGVLGLRVSGFGGDGPMSDYRVYANNVQAYGGLTWMTRDDHGEVARFGSVLADPLSSVIGATVVAAWALGPMRLHGGVADLSMVEVVARCVAEYASASSTGVDIEPPPGNELAPYSPHGVYLSSDRRWVAIAVSDDDEWAALVRVLESPSELDRPEWCLEKSRLADRELVDSELGAVVGRFEAADVVGRLVAEGLRVADVLAGADLVSDPHLNSRGFFPTVIHPALGTARIVGLPWRFADEGPVIIRGAPELGSTSIAAALERFHER